MNLFAYMVFLKMNANTLIDSFWAFMQFAIAVLTFYVREDERSTAGASASTSNINNNNSNNNNSNAARNLLVLVLAFLWAIRLGGFIFVNRVLAGENDPRYEAMAKSFYGPNLKSYTESHRRFFFFVQFMLQAVLVVFPSVPVTFFAMSAARNQAIDQQPLLFWLGAALVLTGIVFSYISDQQLQAYKVECAAKSRAESAGGEKATNGATKKGICRNGWWQKSRHPNLFFELVTHTEFAVIAMTGIDTAAAVSSLSYFSALFPLLGPFCLYLIMRCLTVPITEKTMRKSRPNWDELTAGTNMFWPF